jgi:NADH:ubiquinone oxidoreductase subunit K
VNKMQSIDQRTMGAPPAQKALPGPDGVSTAVLIKQAVDEARELVRLEIALAKNEVKSEAKDARRAAIAFGVSAGLAVGGVTMFFVAIALAFSSGPVAALIVGAIVLVIAACASLIGVGLFPRKPLVETRHRLESDVRIVKEHVA